MSGEEKNTDDNLDNSIDGEFKSGDTATVEDTKSDGLGASGSESDLSKKQRLQTPSPKPSPLPFMVQGMIRVDTYCKLSKMLNTFLFLFLSKILYPLLSTGSGRPVLT